MPARRRKFTVSVQFRLAPLQDPLAVVLKRSCTIALGIARLQNGLAPLQNAFTALQNGLAPLQNAFAALFHVLAVVRGSMARLFRRLDGLLGFLVVLRLQLVGHDEQPRAVQLALVLQEVLQHVVDEAVLLHVVLAGGDFVVIRCI